MAKNSQDWATAVREFDAALAWDPENAKADYDLAAALKANVQLEEAAHQLQIARRLSPALAAPQ